MNSKRSSRRQFLQRAAAAGLAAGAVGSASAQSRGVAAKPEAKPMLAEASRFPFSGLEVTKRIDHITYYTPIQDSAGIITPAPLHFMQTHASEIPDLDPKEHRLTIHGMERPLSFTLHRWLSAAEAGNCIRKNKRGLKPAFRSSVSYTVA